MPEADIAVWRGDLPACVRWIVTKASTDRHVTPVKVARANMARIGAFKFLRVIMRVLLR